jgi:hypothetical protein
VRASRSVVSTPGVVVELSEEEAKELLWTTRRAAGLCCSSGSCDACRLLKGFANWLEEAL